MEIKLLAMGMQDLYDAWSAAQILAAGGKLKDSLGGALMEKAIEQALIGINQGIELCRDCKNQMEIRSVNDLGLAGVNPEFLQDGLTAGTGPAAAGIVVYLDIPTFPAGIDITVQFPGFAVHDGGSGFSLSIGGLKMLAEIMKRGGKHLLYFMHENPPYGQKD